VTRGFQSDSMGGSVPAKCEPTNIRRILVPLDGSSACEAVMPYARELGQLLGAMIVILHVRADASYDPSGFSGSRVTGRPEGPAPSAQASPHERILYAAQTFSAAGLETMEINLGGEPASTILDFARPSAVDLIAMTSHGRTGLSKFILGSVAERVLKESVLPTLIVKSTGTEAPQCLT